MQLFDLEAEVNTLREEKSGAYSVARHVEILIALAGEAQMMQAAARPLS